MSNEAEGRERLGGVSFIISASLFLVKYLLDLISGPPPSRGAEILEWTAAQKLPLAFVSEVLFFAATFLIPGVIALYRRLASIDRTKAALGCGIIAAEIPVIFVLLIVHGRLVYPIYDIRIHDPAVAELVVFVFYGGLHAVGLSLGVATIVLSLVLRRGGYGKPITYLGMAAGLFDFIGAYPDRIGPIPILVSQGLFAAWFLVVGWKLYRKAPSTA